MRRVLLGMALLAMAACGAGEQKESGAITGVSADAKQARTAAQDAAAAAEAAARRVEAASQVPPEAD